MQSRKAIAHGRGLERRRLDCRIKSWTVTCGHMPPQGHSLSLRHGSGERMDSDSGRSVQAVPKPQFNINGGVVHFDRHSFPLLSESKLHEVRFARWGSIREEGRLFPFVNTASASFVCTRCSGRRVVKMNEKRMYINLEISVIN
jgi:hypothetical protein